MNLDLIYAREYDKSIQIPEWVIDKAVASGIPETPEAIKNWIFEEHSQPWSYENAVQMWFDDQLDAFDGASDFKINQASAYNQKESDC